MRPDKAMSQSELIEVIFKMPNVLYTHVAIAH
jgi:hypothetical protein